MTKLKHAIEVAATDEDGRRCTVYKLQDGSIVDAIPRGYTLPAPVGYEDHTTITMTCKEAMKLKPGNAITFATEVKRVPRYYDPFTASMRTVEPGELRRGIVLSVTDKGGILVWIRSGRERGRKTWVHPGLIWAEQRPRSRQVPTQRLSYQRVGVG